MEAAFEIGSGFSAAGLSLFVRGMIASLFAIWVVWAAYMQYKLMAAEKMSSGDWFFSVVKLFTLLVIVLVIVGV